MDRKKLGTRVGILGVSGNCVLFIIKFAMGTAANSIAIIADSFNNLIDGTSSLITISGFQLSGRKRDAKHPFGYGRTEYICGFIIALMILAAAFSLGKRSFMRLMNPEKISVENIMFLVPMCSILIKVSIIYYTKRMNRILDSSALRASVREAYADILITFLTIITLLTAPYTDFPVDGAAGLAITLFIMWSGLTALSENMDLLIGKCADKALEENVRSLMMDYEVFESVISFNLHDYGPQEQIAVIHVMLKRSLPPEEEISAAVKDSARRLREDFGLEPVIYWQP